MAKKEISNTTTKDGKKMRVKDLIFAGAFAAIYVVVMLLIVMVCGTIPVLYLITPLFVGIVCATIYELCVLKVHKFGAALILGILFAVTASSGYLPGMFMAIGVAVLAEVVLMIGKYKSKKLFLISYLVFNLNMVCPFSNLYLNRDSFMAMAADYYGESYANGVAALTTSWMPFAQMGLAVAGAGIGVLIASKLIKKHFEKAGIV